MSARLPGHRAVADAGSGAAAAADADEEADRRRPTVRMDTPVATAGAAIFSADDDVSASALRPTQGRRLGRYELLFEMGSGGMATLHLAQIGGPKQFEKLVAIKKIHEHLTGRQDFVDMFLDEARISARIQHPNVVQLFDLGEVDGSYFIAMEYVHGANFAGVLRAVTGQGSQLYGWHTAAWIVSEAAAGLHAAHELKTLDGRPLNLVHRDVSPQNILVSYDGNVKVADFGIAFAAERITHTESGVLKGKIPYMAPEQASGKTVDRRADVFALGTLLYESVCLRRLFKEPNEAASLNRVVHADVPAPRSVNPDLPEGLERIILKALAKDPGQRYQTAAELRDDLRRLLLELQITVGAPQLAEVMVELFDGKKQQLDRQITEATQSHIAGAAAAPVPLPAAPSEEEASSASSSASAVTGAGERAGSRLWPIILMSVVVFLATTVAVVWWTWPREAAKAKRTARPAQHAMDASPMTAARPRARPLSQALTPVKPLLVRFKVLTRRASATIHFRGKAYRQNRLQLLVKPGPAAESVRVVASGYKPIERTIVVSAQAQLNHEFRLKRKRRSRSGRRRVRPMREAAM